IGGYFWRLASPRSRHQQIWCLVRACFLIHRWSSSYCILTWQRGPKRAFWGPLYIDTNLIYDGLSCMT
uniref:Uncharacterized protein n=1 Tax=Sciurus vulgaris TaxID=55149 RepID=A0A8D2JMV8_SCIVU